MFNPKTLLSSDGYGSPRSLVRVATQRVTDERVTDQKATEPVALVELSRHTERSIPVETLTHTEHTDQVSQMADEATLSIPLIPAPNVPLTTVPLVESFGEGRCYDSCLSISDLASRRQANNPTPNPTANLPWNRLDQSDYSSLSEPLQLQLQQLQHYVQQQERLHKVERSLRQSLHLPTILRTTVIESAALLQARQVSLFCCVSGSDGLSDGVEKDIASWNQVAQYCQNQTLAWQQAFSITQLEFPDLMRQLDQGKTLQIFPGPSSPITSERDEIAGLISNSSTFGKRVSQSLATETRQWLAYWPGSWLLLPIKNESVRNPSSGGYSSGQSSEALGNQPSGYWGAMALALPADETWTEAAIAQAQSIGAELAISIRQAQQYQALEVANQGLQKLALLDGLTSLANRRCFDEHLAHEWQRLARDQQPLSMILCDLDHFKDYNDTFGHPAGDRCLIRIAKALLKGPQRPADLVARYGGEEFAIILPNTDTHGAWRIAQKIHDSIRELKIAHAPDADEDYVTVTMGVSTVIPGHDTTAQMLIQASDLALYHAKQQGRNRTYVHAYYNTVKTENSADSNLDSSPALTPAEDSSEA